MTEQTEYVLGGRRFVPVGEATTAEHDDWMAGQLEQAGLLGGVLQASRGEIADVDLSRLRGSGRSFALLAGGLVEVGQEWTPERAAEVEQHLRHLTDPNEKAQLFAMLGGMLRGFFVPAPGSSAPTASSSSPTGDAAPEASPGAAPSPSANGPTSSSAAPATPEIAVR